jgi:DNA-directed RNA polymerase subunit E'/Rpb7
MILEKVIDCTINIDNPIHFCTNKDEYLLKELNQNFVERCFKGVYIIEILHIVKCGPCAILKNLSAEAYIDVSFAARAITYCKEDIITGVSIKSTQQIVIGTTPNAVVTILADKNSQFISMDQIIPVKVNIAHHSPHDSHISVIGSLLTCDQYAPTYFVKDSTLSKNSCGEDFHVFYKSIIHELKLREEMISNSKKGEIWFFEMLLYHFGANKDAREQSVVCDVASWHGPGGITEGSHKNLLSIADQIINGDEGVSVGGFWSRPLSIYRSSPLIAHSQQNTAGAETVSAPARIVFTTFLKNILDNLVCIREMVEVYNTEEMIRKHMNIWKIMKSAQRV